MGLSVLSHGPRHSGSRSSITPSPSLSSQSPHSSTWPAHEIGKHVRVPPPSSRTVTPASETTTRPSFWMTQPLPSVGNTCASIPPPSPPPFELSPEGLPPSPLLELAHA